MTDWMEAHSPVFAEPQAAYIHVPFCSHRCGYCDFTLVADRNDLFEDYLRALELELATLVERRTVKTLFLGGGTPTQPTARNLRRLLATVGKWFEVSDEYSVEANPEGFDDEKLGILIDAGVNRISLGVQAFDTTILRTLEREHVRETVEEVVGLIQQRLDNISLDLIFAVPGQSLELWDKTLREALQLQPRHVSTYGLTFEKGTRFWSMRERNEFRLVDEETERAMYALAMERFVDAGYEHYEISSFAQTGYHCRHNETYWAGLPYFAFGPGAARYINGRRETNHRSVTGWLRKMLSGKSAIGESEELCPEDRAREAIALGLRRSRGISRATLREYFGADLDELAGTALRINVEAGLLEDNGDAIALTREGRFVADSVVSSFL